MLKSIERFFLISLFALISACGFHLQGHVNLPSQLNTLYISSNSPYDSFSQELTKRLTENKVNVVSNQTLSPITLRILNTTVSNDTVGNNSSEQTRVYRQTYYINYELTDEKGKIVLPPNSVSASTTYTLAPGDLPDNTPTSAITQSELQQQAITALFIKLSATDTKKSLLKYDENKN